MHSFSPWRRCAVSNKCHVLPLPLRLKFSPGVPGSLLHGLPYSAQSGSQAGQGFDGIRELFIILGVPTVWGYLRHMVHIFKDVYEVPKWCRNTGICFKIFQQRKKQTAEVNVVRNLDDRYVGFHHITLFKIYIWHQNKTFKNRSSTCSMKWFLWWGREVAGEEFMEALLLKMFYYFTSLCVWNVRYRIKLILNIF